MENNHSDRPSAILMGSKPGSVVALEIMLSREWTIPAVVVSEGVSHDWFDGPTLSEVARRNGIDVLLQAEIPEGLSVDFVISYMYRHKVTPSTLALAQVAALNFHAAPLPRFGGWAFYNVAILEDCKQYGVTCHYMDEGFDTGPLLKVRNFDIDCRKETAISLERKSQKQMIELFHEFVRLAESGTPLPCVAQNPNQMRYMTKSEFAALKRIPADSSQKEIDRIARAFWYPPYQCAFVEFGDAQLEVVPELAKQSIAEQEQLGVYEELKNAVHRCELHAEEIEI